MSNHFRESFSCNVCQEVFTNPGELALHQIKHADKKKLICKHCGKQFKRTSSLNVHYSTHRDWKAFKCRYCGRGFHQKHNLKIHMDKRCRANYGERERKLSSQSETKSPKSEGKVAVLDNRRAAEILSKKSQQISKSTSIIVSAGKISDQPFVNNMISHCPLSSTSRKKRDCPTVNEFPAHGLQNTARVDHNTETILRYLKESPESHKHSNCIADTSHNVKQSHVYNNDSELNTAIRSITENDHSYQSLEKPDLNVRRINSKNSSGVVMPGTVLPTHKTHVTLYPSKSDSNIHSSARKGCLKADTSEDLKLNEHLSKDEKMREHLICLINLMTESKANRFTRMKVRQLLAVNEAERKLFQCLQSQKDKGQSFVYSASDTIQCLHSQKDSIHNSVNNPNARITTNVASNILPGKGILQVESPQTNIPGARHVKSALLTFKEGKHINHSTSDVSSDHTRTSIQGPLIYHMKTEASFNKPIAKENPQKSVCYTVNSSGRFTKNGKKPEHMKPFGGHYETFMQANANVLRRNEVCSIKAPPRTSPRALRSIRPKPTPPVFMITNGSQVIPTSGQVEHGMTMAIVSQPSNGSIPASLNYANNRLIVTPVPNVQPSPGSRIAYKDTPSSKSSGNGEKNKNSTRTNIPILPKLSSGYRVYKVLSNPDSYSTSTVQSSPVWGTKLSQDSSHTSNVVENFKTFPPTGIVNAINPNEPSSANMVPNSLLEDFFTPKQESVTDTYEALELHVERKQNAVHNSVLPTHTLPILAESSPNSNVTVTPVVLDKLFSIPDNRIEDNSSKTIFVPESKRQNDFIQNTPCSADEPVVIESSAEPSSNENRMDIILSSSYALKTKPEASSEQEYIHNGKDIVFSPPEESVSLDFLNSESRDRNEHFRLTPVDKFEAHQVGKYQSISDVAIDNSHAFERHNYEVAKSSVPPSCSLPISFGQFLQQENMRKKNNAGESETCETKDATSNFQDRDLCDTNISNCDLSQSVKNGHIETNFTLNVYTNKKHSSTDTRQNLAITGCLPEIASPSGGMDTLATEIKHYSGSPVKGCDVENSNLSSASQGELLDILHSLLKDIPKQISPGKGDGGLRLGFSPIKGMTSELGDVTSIMNLNNVFSAGSQLETGSPKSNTVPDTSPLRIVQDHKRRKTSKDETTDEETTSHKPNRVFHCFAKSTDNETVSSDIVLGDSLPACDKSEVCDNRELSDIRVMGDYVTFEDNDGRISSEVDDIMRPLVVGAPDLFDENTIDQIVRVVEDMRALNNASQ